MAGRDVLRRLVAAALAGALVLLGAPWSPGGGTLALDASSARGATSTPVSSAAGSHDDSAPAYLARGRLLLGGVGATRDLHGKALSTLPAPVVLARSTMPGGAATTLVRPDGAAGHAAASPRAPPSARF